MQASHISTGHHCMPFSSVQPMGAAKGVRARAHCRAVHDGHMHQPWWLCRPVMSGAGTLVLLDSDAWSVPGAPTAAPCFARRIRHNYGATIFLLEDTLPDGNRGAIVQERAKGYLEDGTISAFVDDMVTLITSNNAAADRCQFK